MKRIAEEFTGGRIVKDGQDRSAAWADYEGLGGKVKEPVQNFRGHNPRFLFCLNWLLLYNKMQFCHLCCLLLADMIISRP
jgi:hypothetical protein